MNIASGGDEIPVELFQILKKRYYESAAFNMLANLENSAVATGLERSLFIPKTKKGNAKECSNHHTTALINGNPLQCSCLENPRDGGTWWAAVCGVAQSRT